MDYHKNKYMKDHTCPHTLRRKEGCPWMTDKMITISSNDKNFRERFTNNWKYSQYLEENACKAKKIRDFNSTEIEYILNEINESDIEYYLSNLPSEPTVISIHHADHIHHTDVYEYAVLPQNVVPLNFSIKVSDSHPSCQPHVARIYRYVDQIDDDEIKYHYWKPRSAHPILGIDTTFFMVDFKQDILISHIGIMGIRQNEVGEWIKLFDLYGKKDNEDKWTYIDTHKGNNDGTKEVLNKINTKDINYRYYKIVPITYHVACSAKFMFYGNVNDLIDVDNNIFDVNMFDINKIKTHTVTYPYVCPYIRENRMIAVNRSSMRNKYHISIKADKSDRYERKNECRKMLKDQDNII